MENSEEWRPVVGFEDSYEVSSHGRVRGKYRIGPGGSRIQPKIIKQSLSSGYPFVGIRDCAGKQYSPRVHALVAQAFLGPRPRGLVINHKDHNKTNNHISNLEYVTSRENIQHEAREGRLGSLCTEEVQAIRSLVSRDPGFDLDSIAKKLGVSLSVVLTVVECRCYCLIPNKDGSMPVPLLSTYRKTMLVEDITDMIALGFTVPEIGRYYKVEYSAPYQALRRAGIWQIASKKFPLSENRRAQKRLSLQRDEAA